MSNFYILDGDHNLIPADVRTWGDWFENTEKLIVAQTQIGGIFVSTVCLGIDHNFTKIGPPHLFETMIFVAEGEQGCFRCATWAEAEAQHARTVAHMQELAAQSPNVIVPIEDIEDAE